MGKGETSNGTKAGCFEGSQGPLCTMCQPEYHLSWVKEEGDRCVSCLRVDQVWLGPLLLGGVAIAAAACAYWLPAGSPPPSL